MISYCCLEIIYRVLRMFLCVCIYIYFAREVGTCTVVLRTSLQQVSVDYTNARAVRVGFVTATSKSGKISERLSVSHALCSIYEYIYHYLNDLFHHYYYYSMFHGVIIFLTG